MLEQNSLDQLAEYDQERATANLLGADLEGRISPDLVDALNKVVEAERDAGLAWAWLCAEELARHLPLVAPCIPHLWEHVVTNLVANVGRCCTGPGGHASVAPIPPGTRRRPSRTSSPIGPDVLQALASQSTPELMRQLEAGSFEAAERYDVASKAEREYEAVCIAALAPKIQAFVRKAIELRSRDDEALREWEVAEVKRHLGPLAAIVGLVWEHVAARGPHDELCCAGLHKADADGN